MSPPHPDHRPPRGITPDAPTVDPVPLHDASTGDGPAPGAGRDAPTGPAAAPAVADLRPGLRLGGRFELVGLLGRGGMGSVWRARDLSVEGQREVALKLVAGASSPGDEGRLARFQREGEVTAALRHPGIVRVHAAGELDGLPFLAYELVEGGRTLEHLLGPDTPLVARVTLLRDVARALGHAHARGLVHRDVKAANVLVDAAGLPRLADFGLAAAAGLERLTQTGAIVGTPTHMAPEQIGARAEQIGPRTDVWALGVLVYQALTGSLPFTGTTFAALGVAIATASYRAPRALAPDAPEALERVVRGALAPDPADRYPHADAVADDLDRWLAGRPTLGAVAPARRRRRWRAAGALAVAALAGVVAAGWEARARAWRAAERDALAREAERVARRAVGSREPLAADAAERTALEARLAAADDDPRLAGPRLRLAALAALFEGRGDPAALLEPARGLARAGAVDDGLLALLEGAAADDPARLGRAVEAGWTRPEVLLRRTRAVGARGLPVDEAEARRLLRDLDTALGAGLALDGRAHAARALALARLRQPDQAAAALAACDAPAPAVEWAVALARVVVGLDRSGELGLSAQLPASAPPPAHADEARALATLARERAGPALRTLRRDPDALTPEEVSQAVDRMVVAARLAPDAPVEPRDVDALIGAVMSVRRRIPARVAVHLVSLAPDDRKLLAALARFARAENTSSKRQLLPVVRRAYDLAVTVEERRELGLFLCIVLDGLDPERPHDVDALVTELLLDDERDDVSRSTLYELRQKARRHLGRFEEALADVDEALRLVPERDLLLVSRAQVLVDLGRRDEGLEVALDYVRRTEFAREAKVSVGSLDHAARLVWEVGVPLGRAADVRRVLERYLVARAERWGWAARAAHLALLDGDRADALDLLQRAANALQKEGSAAERAAFGLPLQAAHDAVSAEAPDADARLRRLVDELDRVRGSAMLP